MGIKKIGDAALEKPQTTGFDYETEQRKIAEAMANIPLSTVDSSEPNNIKLEITEIVDEKILREDASPAFPDPEESRTIGETLHPKEFYDNLQGAFQPAVEVKPPNSSGSGFTHEETKRQLTEEERIAHVSKELTRPASQQDLRNLDESIIMNMPMIKASDMKLVDALNPRPIDPTIRFKWVNFKNAVQGNLYRYLALGFKTAEKDDIDQEKTPTDPSMIDGTQIKYYDVILLKINVLRLMELYKSNIIRSVMRLGRVKEKGKAEAERQFRQDISTVPGAAKYYNDFTAVKGHAPVEFEITS